MTGWPLFFMVVGITFCTAKFIAFVDWIGGHK